MGGSITSTCSFFDMMALLLGSRLRSGKPIGYLLGCKTFFFSFFVLTGLSMVWIKSWFESVSWVAQSCALENLRYSLSCKTQVPYPPSFGGAAEACMICFDRIVTATIKSWFEIVSRENDAQIILLYKMGGQLLTTSKILQVYTLDYQCKRHFLAI